MKPTIILPFPTAKLSGHNSGGWRKHAPTVKRARALAWATTMEHKTRFSLPGDKADILIEMRFYPPDRRSDRVNFANRMKPYIDGIAEALGVNDARFLPDYKFCAPDKENPRVEVDVARIGVVEWRCQKTLDETAEHLLQKHGKAINEMSANLMLYGIAGAQMGEDDMFEVVHPSAFRLVSPDAD